MNENASGPLQNTNQNANAPFGISGTEVPAFPGAARASIVNRTRRVIREQAVGMQKQRQKTRSLGLPVLICSVLLLITCYAGWALLDASEFLNNGVLDASYESLVFLAWSLPVTILITGLIWRQRTHARLSGEL